MNTTHISDDRDHFAALADRRQSRERVRTAFLEKAERTSRPHRRWFRISEIEPDEQRRQELVEKWLRYRDSLPKDGPLFPGMERRAKIGARVGELFGKRLKALGLKRDGLVFHSFRHTVSSRLEAAGVSQTDAARVLGHTIPGMSYGTHSTGPGLKRLAAVIEEISYPRLTLPATV
jgi:integrase